VAEPPAVLLVANFAARVGGGEESLLLLARGLDRARFAPHAVVPAEGEMATLLRAAGVPVVVLPLPALRPWTLPAVARAWRRLRRLLADRRIALVHAHGSRGALYAGLAARGLGVPLVWHARIADRDPRLDPLLLGLATRVIAISEAVAARFTGSPRAGRVRVVYNGIDLERWQPGPSPPREGLEVLLPGRLMPDKGQATLLRAAPAVLARHRGTRFVLLGADAGGEGARLRALARTLGVEAAVELCPWASDPRAAFQAADVVVLPSRSEGFGRVLVEAGCLAKPVVASRVGGIPEIVADGETGLLVPPGDPPALAEALNRLLADPTLRAKLGAAARARALERFGAARHVAGVQQVYAEALDAGGGS
jgi:glycosyltransferase involved in cell wall biosynthesis